MSHVAEGLIRKFGRKKYWRGKSRIEVALERIPRPTRRIRAFAPYNFQMEIDWNNELERSMFVRDLEPDTTWLLASLLSETSKFWDVGANIGFFSLIASKEIGVREVHAFEPSPLALRALRRNLDLNAIHNVRVHDLALGKSNCVRPLFARHPSNHGMNSLYGDTAEVQIACVHVRSADELIAAGLSTPDIIKVDVEGGEVDFILGAQQLLVHSRPQIVIEVSRPTLHAAGQTPEDLLKLLKDMGYRAYWPWRRELIEVDGLSLPHEHQLGPGHGSNYFLSPCDRDQ